MEVKVASFWPYGDSYDYILFCRRHEIYRYFIIFPIHLHLYRIHTYSIFFVHHLKLSKHCPIFTCTIFSQDFNALNKKREVVFCCCQRTGVGKKYLFMNVKKQSQTNRNWPVFTYAHSMDSGVKKDPLNKTHEFRYVPTTKTIWSLLLTFDKIEVVLITNKFINSSLAKWEGRGEGGQPLGLLT